MSKIFKWIKKKIKCFNSGHDWYYNKYSEYFHCKVCGKVTKFPSWDKED